MEQRRPRGGPPLGRQIQLCRWLNGDGRLELAPSSSSRWESIGFLSAGAAGRSKVKFICISNSSVRMGEMRFLDGVFKFTAGRGGNETGGQSVVNSPRVSGSITLRYESEFSVACSCKKIEEKLMEFQSDRIESSRWKMAGRACGGSGALWRISLRSSVSVNCSHYLKVFQL